MSMCYNGICCQNPLQSPNKAISLSNIYTYNSYFTVFYVYFRLILLCYTVCLPYLSHIRHLQAITLMPRTHLLLCGRLSRHYPGANIQYKSHSTKRKTTYSIFLSDIFLLIPFLRIKLPTYSVFHNWRADFGNDKEHQHTLGESMYQSLRFPNLLFIKLTFFSIYDTISSILS